MTLVIAWAGFIVTAICATPTEGSILWHHKPITGVIKTLKEMLGLADSGSNGVWPMNYVVFNHPIQSPIDIITEHAVTMDLPTLEFLVTNCTGSTADFYNSGHTVYVYIDAPNSFRSELAGGPLQENYILEQLHFHWGNEDVWGSEHFVDGESYAVEIHAVLFNRKYDSFENASTQHDGLAVLTLFAETNSTDNELLNPLCALLPNLTKANSRVKLPALQALQWVGSAFRLNHEYYTYPGSLTTEPYSENVIFILLPDPITLSHDQLNEFRGIHSETDHQVMENKRQLQPLHNRPIVRSTSMRISEDLTEQESSF